MAFLTKIKKGIKHPLLRKILIVLVLVTVLYLIIRRYKLKEGMNGTLENIINQTGALKLNDFISEQKRNNTLYKKRNNDLDIYKNIILQTASQNNIGENEIYVIEPKIQLDSGWTNPVDNMVGGRDEMITGQGGIILNNDDNICMNLKNKQIKYKSRGPKANICDSNLFIVFGAPNNLVGTLNTPAEPEPSPDSNPLIDKIRGILTKVSDRAQAPEINVFRLMQKEMKKVQTKRNYNKIVKWQELFTDNTEPFKSDVFVIPPIKIDRKLQNPLDRTPLKRSVIESNGGTILNVDGNTCPEKINRIIYKGYESEGVRNANMCNNKLFIVFRYNGNINNINKNKKPQNITQGLPQRIFNKNVPEAMPAGGPLSF